MTKIKILSVVIVLLSLTSYAEEDCSKLKQSSGPRGSCLKDYLKENPDFSCNYVAKTICTIDPNNLEDKLPEHKPKENTVERSTASSRRSEFRN